MTEFDRLLEQFRPAAERWVRFRVNQPQDAEDILQETYLAAYQGFSRLSDPSLFRPWLIGIARNKWMDWIRKKEKRQEVTMDSLPDRPAAGKEPAWVSDTLECLPPKDRRMLLLFYQEQLPQSEIARMLRIPEGTVKSRLHAARAHFRDAYPYPPKGENDMIEKLPKVLPAYTITWKKEAPFPVVWEELIGWMIVPRLGEKMAWGMYDLPSRKMDVAYDLAVTGKAKVHGLEGVSIKARVIQPLPEIKKDDPMSEIVSQSGAPQEEWTFVAQLADGCTRFLSAERNENGVRTLTTFLDGDEFMNNWGCGENNRGNPIHLAPKGLIARQGNIVAFRGEKGVTDVAGRCELRMNGKTIDTVCVMTLDEYDEGMASEQYLDKSGRTVLWRRFNRDDWRQTQYGKTWSQMLPENERLTINGQTYVHWYDCLCVR